jgi:hypothetical protein
VSAVVDRHSLQVVLYALLRKNRRSLAIQGACNDLDPVFTNPGFGKKAGNQPEMKTSPISTSRSFLAGLRKTSEKKMGV